jgi:hypothetical protein
VDPRTVGQDRIANARPLGALQGGEHERLGNGGAQNMRGVQCVHMMAPMQMRPVQVLAV